MEHRVTTDPLRSRAAGPRAPADDRQRRTPPLAITPSLPTRDAVQYAPRSRWTPQRVPDHGARAPASRAPYAAGAAASASAALASRRATSARTIGATSVPKRSIERRMSACSTAPTLMCPR